MSLRATQELFWRAIRWPTGIEEFLDQASEETRETFRETFAQTKSFGRIERVQVYADAYFYRLLDVLADEFEVTAWLMGQRRFHNFVTDFVLAKPSEDADIRRFGERLPDFVSQHPEAQRIQGIEDIANVERAIVRSIDTKNDTALTPDQLAKIPVERWPSLRFELTPATQVLPCRLPFDELWRQFRAQRAAPHELDVRERQVLVWREHHEVFHRTCDPAEGRALVALAKGQTFEQICDVAAGVTTTDASAQDVVTWLQQWLTAGLILRVTPSS